MGIDENGLGPRLGPLVVTSILARTTDEGAQLVHGAEARRPTRTAWGAALRRRLGDSKMLVSFEDSALGEAWARALAGRTGLPKSALDHPDALAHALAVDSRDRLRADCPGHHPRAEGGGQCWSAEGESFSAEDRLVRAIDGDLDRLEARGVTIVRVRVAIVCAQRLNDAAARGLSRFDVDLHAMERLVLAAREDAKDEINATCGKVGGFDRYAASFGPLAGRLHTPLVEGRARSAYRVLGVGDVAFVRDADAAHLLVCMASLVGKWTRDLLMRRIVRYHRAVSPHPDALPDASGYHDPVTTRFIRATALTRKDHKIEDRCFIRTRVDEAMRAVD